MYLFHTSQSKHESISCPALGTYQHRINPIQTNRSTVMEMRNVGTNSGRQSTSKVVFFSISFTSSDLLHSEGFHSDRRLMGHGVQHWHRNGFRPGYPGCTYAMGTHGRRRRGVFCSVARFDTAPGGLYTTFFLFLFTFFSYLPVPRDFRSDTPFFFF
jgi:hypothetical protein